MKLKMGVNDDHERQPKPGAGTLNDDELHWPSGASGSGAHATSTYGSGYTDHEAPMLAESKRVACLTTERAASAAAVSLY